MSSPTPLTDEMLIAAARDGDAAAWETLVDRYDGLLRKVCRAHRLSETDGADVTQTTWLRALEHIDRLEMPDRFGAWLATVARHECLRTLRHATRISPCDDELLDRRVGAAAAPDDRLLAAEREDAVRGAVMALRPRDRRLVGLLYNDADPSYTNISRRLAMPIGSIGPTRGRVLERIRRQPAVARLAA